MITIRCDHCDRDVDLDLRELVGHGDARGECDHCGATYVARMDWYEPPRGGEEDDDE